MFDTKNTIINPLKNQKLQIYINLKHTKFAVEIYRATKREKSSNYVYNKKKKKCFKKLDRY